MIETVGLHVLGYIAAHQPDFAFLDPTVRLVEREPAAAEALYLAPDQHDPAFERIEHFVFVPGLAILSDHALVIVLAIRRVFLLRLLGDVLGQGAALSCGEMEG